MKRGVGRETAEQCAPTALSAVSPADLHAAVLLGLLTTVIVAATVLA